MPSKAIQKAVLIGVAAGVLVGAGVFAALQLATTRRPAEAEAPSLPARPQARSDAAKRPPDFAREYARAAAAAAAAIDALKEINWDHYARAYHERLAAGEPVGVDPAVRRTSRAVRAWRDHLTDEARNAYSRKCIDLARRVLAGDTDLPTHILTTVCRPMDLYGTAYNVAVDPALRRDAAARFYVLADKRENQPIYYITGRPRPVRYRFPLTDWDRLDVPDQAPCVPDPRRPKP